MFAFGSNFQKIMLQNVFQFRSPFRKYSLHLVPHSTRINLGLTQIITVILLIATIIGKCQRVSRSNLKIKPKYYALTLKPRIKFPPKIKFKSDILTHLYLYHSYTSVPVLFLHICTCTILTHLYLYSSYTYVPVSFLHTCTCTILIHLYLYHSYTSVYVPAD